MGKLIDADKLKEAIRKKLCPEKNLTLHVIYAVLEEIIDEQPKAYSVQEVLEALEKEIKPLAGTYNADTPMRERASYKKEYNTAIQRAMEIVWGCTE